MQAVRKIIPAPARFWDRGARWFVVRLYVLEQLVTSCSVFWRRFADSLKQSLATEGGLRLHELERGTEVTPSWRLEVIGS